MLLGDFFKKIKNKKARIAVLGDVGIDVYHYGTVTRVSPEFPVPILKSNSSNHAECCPAMAANVCHQLRHFNASVSLFGFIDSDFINDLKPCFDTTGCVLLPTGNVPRKIRFYDSNFPLLRWDIEQQNYGESCLPRQQVLDNFASRINEFDIVIMSNYDKGLFDANLISKVIDMCDLCGLTTIVDPKNHPERWSGCTIFKPNAKEATLMTNSTDWREQCDLLQTITCCQSVLITQAGSGVAGKENDYFEYRPKNKALDVSSVIGAGDCFLAILSWGTAHGLTIMEASELAFAAGVQYVKARHNNPITPHDLHCAVNPIMAKIMSADEFEGSGKVIIANGAFDVLHVGHTELLQYAKSLGDKLVVAINSDESVRRLKGDSRPINSLQNRMELLANLQCVDFVIPFCEDTPYELIKKIKPDIICKGGDYKKEDVVGNDIVGLDNVCLFPYQEGHSTTNLIRKISVLD